METGRLTESKCIAPEHYMFTVSLPSSFTTPFPGQFVMIRDPQREEPLLPRPLSVFGFRRAKDRAFLELLYRVTGRGTSIFSRMKPGDLLTVTGPLGHGFTPGQDAKLVILLAGGVGVAPLAFLLHEVYFLAAAQHRIKIIVYVGARTAALLAGIDRFKGVCDLRIATEDGSAGYRGLVTDLLRGDLCRYLPDETLIHACGPTAMVRSLGLLLEQSNIRCEVSMEERMACGMGACLGCAVAMRGGKEKNQYQRVCHDGPVFNLKDLDLKS